MIQKMAQRRGTVQLNSGARKFLCTTQRIDKHEFGAQYRFVQINLPIHEPTRDNKFLDAVNTLLFHHKLIIDHIEHFQDALTSDLPFNNAAEKTIARQIVETIHIQLTTDELMKKSLVVLIVENGNGHRKAPFEMLIQLRHNERRNLLMMHFTGDGILQRVAEWSVSDIVQQDGAQERNLLFIINLIPLEPKFINRVLHQVHSANGMLKTIMQCSGIHHV